jgi:hypothetical protein
MASGRIHLVHFFCSPFWFTHTPVRLAVIIRCSQLMVENVHALTARSYGPSVTVRILTQSLKYSAHVRVASAALAGKIVAASAMRHMVLTRIPRPFWPPQLAASLFPRRCFHIREAFKAAQQDLDPIHQILITLGREDRGEAEGHRPLPTLRPP